MGKVDDRRAALRQNLIEITEKQIIDAGLDSVRARDLAAQAGCAVGAIYNVFGDLNDLFLAVNARTFEKLGLAVAASLEHGPSDPTQQLIVMGKAYHRFVADNLNLWRALFDLDRRDDASPPEWYLAEMARLFAYISAPIAVLFADRTDTEQDLLTRGLFSSVHGIVMIGLDGINNRVPSDEIDQLITVVLQQLAINPTKN